MQGDTSIEDTNAQPAIVFVSCEGVVLRMTSEIFVRLGAYPFLMPPKSRAAEPVPTVRRLRSSTIGATQRARAGARVTVSSFLTGPKSGC